MESINNKIHLYVFEFFSGIGGMHDALLSNTSAISIQKIYPFDINQNANLTYEYNYNTKPYSISIESFTLLKYNSICKSIYEEPSNFNNNNPKRILWTMSPPCQPFTRQGNCEGLSDNRSTAFKHLINELFLKTEYKPDYFLLENVKNFETSEANELLLNAFKSNNYIYKQFLLSPIQFNIPNSRLRFYVIAMKSSKQHTTTITTSNDIITDTKLFDDDILPEKSISEYLNIKDIVNYEKHIDKRYYLTEKVLNKESSKAMDVVLFESKSSNCFTKNYTRLIKGSGSILLTDSKLYSDNIDLGSCKGKLRFFSPEEILSFMCFKEEFEFPEAISVKSKYRLLGNSINVYVVGKLFKYLFSLAQEE